MNNITSPEILSKLNRSNMQLKEDFLHYLESTQRSPGTIAGYSNDLDIVFTWNYKYNGDVDFIKISKRNWVAFQNWLITENGNSELFAKSPICRVPSGFMQYNCCRPAALRS